MRKLSLIAAASLLVPVAAQAKPLNELLLDKGVLGAAEMKKDAGPARLTYDNGTTLEFPSAGAKWHMNLRTQAVYTLTDPDEDSGQPTSHSFDARNVRLDLGGSVLNDEFSFRVTNDFTQDTDTGESGSKLQDAFIDWHACPESNVRAGQWQTNAGRQWQTDNQYLQFIDRSQIATALNLGRQAGLGYYGTLGGTYSHGLSVFNGESVTNGTTEGQNASGNDNKLLVVYNGGLDLMDHYDRSYEGDPTMSKGSAGLGFSAYYGQNNVDLAAGAGIPSNDIDHYGATVDLGYRGDGMSLQIEGFYDGFAFDEDLPGGEDQSNNFGGYAQAGMMLMENGELAARFGWLRSDNETLAFTSGLLGRPNAQNTYEINVVGNYYLNGHNLKIQTGPTWLILDPEEGSNTTDFRYQVGIFGYF